jgi:cytochrome c-type biogenesis protein CcmF
LNIGYLFTLLASVGILVSTIGFFLAARGNRRFLNLAVTSYHYFFGFVVVASIFLAYLFIAGKYSYRYVFEYSSSDLSFLYRLSGFWAGQRGTYLLWLLLQGLFGYYIIGKGRQYTAPAMVFYGVINIFFCVMLLALSPFEMLPTARVEGAGLNPLLKDPWMVVHPPVIFIGYAAVAVPAVIALAALVKKNYENWLPVSYVPAVVGAVMLAAGNIMGGFWAYKTLGWGGYWAWDPVENSSFIPWMTSLALIHGFLIERTKGSLRKTNLFLALFTFLLVVYGTFLTRSGVLADFSVHSFVDLGVNAYLIIFMVGFTALSLGIFLARFTGIKGPGVDLSITSREFVLLMSVWILVLIGLLVLSGTSWPLITTLLGRPGTVDTGVYTRVTFPLAIIIGLFLGFAPFTLRSGRSYGTLFKKVLPSFLAAVSVTGSFI